MNIFADISSDARSETLALVWWQKKLTKKEARAILLPARTLQSRYYDMAKIMFKAKLRTLYNLDDTVAYQYVSVPVLTRAHCDMNAFRSHPRYGAYANSGLFPLMLAEIRSDRFPLGILRLDDIPAGVTVDAGGFLAKISFDV